MTDQSVTSTDGISFAHDSETEMVLSTVDEFIDREVRPLEADLGETLTNPRLRYETDGHVVDAVLDAIDTVRRKSAETGLYAMNLPESYGGGGVSNVTWYAAKRLVGASGSWLARYLLAGPEGPKPLLLAAEGEQVERYLEPAIAAEKSTAFAQTEPGVGSDSPNMSTTAEIDGEEWVLNGTKQWITNAPYADFMQVFARTTPQSEAGRYGGITCFIVESEEYEVGSMNNAVGQVGFQAEVHFNDVRLPEDRVLGEVGQAFYDAMDFLSLGRLEIGAEAVGRAQFLLDQGIEYAGQREAFGRDIGEFQGVAHKLARGRARNWAADAAGLRLAWQMDECWDTIESASIFKWLATDVYFDVADDVVQVHGANGLAEENPFMDELQYARLLRIVEGTDEIQLNTVARQHDLL